MCHFPNNTNPVAPPCGCLRYHNVSQCVPECRFLHAVEPRLLTGSMTQNDALADLLAGFAPTASSTNAGGMMMPVELSIVADMEPPKFGTSYSCPTLNKALLWLSNWISMWLAMAKWVRARRTSLWATVQNNIHRRFFPSLFFHR